MIKKTDRTPSFKGYYTAAAVKKLEDSIMMAKIYNRNLTDIDIKTMRESIRSFNAFYNGTKTLNSENISNQLYRKFNIPSNFKGDKFLAGCCALAANIFHALKLPQPRGIFKADIGYKAMAHCSVGDRVLSFSDNFHWPAIQSYAIDSKLYNFSSSGHFLKVFLHEFMHNVQAKKLVELASKERKGDILNSPAFIEIRQKPWIDTSKLILDAGKSLSNFKVKALVENKVSDYGATAPADMFADTGAKMICDNLDMRTLRPQKNPFTFKYLEQDKFLMKMMDDFYHGKFEGYV